MGCMLGVPTRLATDQVGNQSACQVNISHNSAKCRSAASASDWRSESDQEDGGGVQGPFDGHPGEE